MENYNDNVFKLEVDEVAQNHLYEMARWGKFLAIIGFIMLGLMVIGGLFFAAFISRLSSGLGQESAMGFSGFGFLYIVFAGLYFYPVYALYKFSVQSKQAIQANNQELFNSALGYLKGMFKYMGILMIIVLALYGLLFVIGIITAGVASSL